MIKKNRLKKVLFMFQKYFYFLFVKNKNDKILKYRIKRNLKKEINKIDRQCFEALNSFFYDLEKLSLVLKKDLYKYIENDPACKDIQEVILMYPGFFCTMSYRIANYFNKKCVPVIPRFISEIAHSITGIDIHPGATIDEGLFIDHGTGTVIGETAEIGKNFKIYQGVTIGAKYINNGLKGIKRHPTIKDNVTVYANAVILGGNTVIGNNVIIGCCAVVTHSVDDNLCVVKKEGTLEDKIQ